jgi:hypothetical protein
VRRTAFVKYGYLVLRLLGNAGSLGRLFRDRVLGSEDLNMLGFTRKARKAIGLFRGLPSTVGSVTKDEGNKLRVNITQASSGMNKYNNRVPFDPAADFRAKTIETYTYLYKKCSIEAKRSEEAFAMLKETLNKVHSALGDTPDTVQLREYVTQVGEFNMVLFKAASFYSHIPALSTSPVSMINTSAASVPPLLKTSETSDADSKIVFTTADYDSPMTEDKPTTDYQSAYNANMSRQSPSRDKDAEDRRKAILLKRQSGFNYHQTDTVGSGTGTSVVGVALSQPERAAGRRFENAGASNDSYGEAEYIDDTNYETDIQRDIDYGIKDQDEKSTTALRVEKASNAGSPPGLSARERILRKRVSTSVSNASDDIVPSDSISVVSCSSTITGMSRRDAIVKARRLAAMRLK